MRLESMVMCALLAMGVVTHAQWLNYPDPLLPRQSDGRPNLSAPAPRTAGGKPDLTGVWHAEITSDDRWRRQLGDGVFKSRLATRGVGMGIGTISIYASNVMADLSPEQQAGLLRPAAIAKMNEPRRLNDVCLLMAFPRAVLLTPVTKFIQAPNVLVMLMEEGNAYRQIYLDGRPLPQDPQPSWFGYSTGHWEGDTLMVASTGFNDKPYLDGVGHPRSESMHMIERYRRIDVGHLEVVMTFDDPVYYTRPFSVTVTHLLQADSDILEYVCNENEKDAGRLSN